MIKRISFAMFLLLVLGFSLGAIQASDANATDIVVNATDGTDYQIDDGSPLDEVGDDTPLSDGNASVEKHQTKLTSPTTSVYYGGNYKVTLIDSNTSFPLSNKRVYFSINDIAYSALTNSKGIASFNLKLNPGTYSINAYFTGDDACEPSDNLSCNVKVLTTIKAGDVTKYYKGSKTYKATFLDSQGKALKNRKVTITVNGKKYTKKTSKNGFVSLPVNLKPGTYRIVATNPVTGYTLTTSFRVLTTLSASSIKKVKGDSKSFTAKFLKSNGKPLAKKYVKVKINGRTHKYRTGSWGTLSLSFKNYKVGTYKVVCYNADGLSKTDSVRIISKATTSLASDFYTFLPGDNKEIKIRFSTNLNDNSKSGKIVKITINGASYSKKTNANGEINFKLPSLHPNVYYFSCSYAGNKFFKSSFTSSYVTILDTADTELTVESDTSFGHLAGTPLKVAYRAGGVPLIKRYVQFNINGTDHSVRTDNLGVAALPIYLDVGNYTVNYKTSDEAKVSGSSGSCEINVFERNRTVITCTLQSSYKDTSQTFKVHLTDLNGTPMAYDDVVLVIGGETFVEMTDANGYATFHMNVAFGYYNVIVRFSGNNNYYESAISQAVNVLISKYANGINEKNAVASKDYLKATSHCQVNNAKIKSLVKSLTKGLTRDVDKAKAIFNYVRDNIYYAYYYDTHKGAVKTLTSKSGNCVDQAHLLVAMYRAAGFKARYVHGSCKFYDDGQYYGHVWTQVLIGRTWICGDPIDYGNQLGKITNWNTKNCKLWAKYRSLPF